MTRCHLSKSSPQEIYLELLHSLEKARTRLAVAIAAETKATPLDRWRYYRETEERMRRCLKELRSQRHSGLQPHRVWLVALEALNHLPVVPKHSGARHGEAQHLCHRLREVLAPLEEQEGCKPL